MLSLKVMNNFKAVVNKRGKYIKPPACIIESP